MLKHVQSEIEKVNVVKVPLVSIIITNYNYEAFLGQAISSALAQSYPAVEVIVVDDGSTDASRAIISSYGERLTPVLKENGGQASAFNAGFAACRGDIIIFLDSDDVLFPDAVEQAVGIFCSVQGISKVQWPLMVVDRNGVPTGETKPGRLPPEGDFRDLIIERGPSNCLSSPTSGNAWPRWFLTIVLPVPEHADYYRTGADDYLYTLAPVFGLVRTIPKPMGFYRMHGGNNYSARSFKDKLQTELKGHSQQSEALSRLLFSLGICVDVQSWRRHSWFHKLQQALIEIEALVPHGHHFILIDDNAWGAEEIFDRDRYVPFPEQDGFFGGLPHDDVVAIAELERARTAGASFVVVAWNASWWLDHFSGLRQHLSDCYPCVVRNDILTIFDLRTGRASADASPSISKQ